MMPGEQLITATNEPAPTRMVAGSAGEVLEAARAKDAAWRQERKAGLRRRLDRLAALARGGPGVLFLSAVPLLLALLFMVMGVVVGWISGAAPPRWVLGWTHHATSAQQGVLVVGVGLVRAARWWHGQLRQRMRAEGLELPDVEPAANPEGDA